MLISSSTMSLRSGSCISAFAVSQAFAAAAMSRALSCVSQVKPSPSVYQRTMIAEALEHAPFAGVPRALDELHHGAFPAIADHAQHEAEGRGRFALAGAGMDDEQALFGDGLGRNLGVLRRLAVRHLAAMALLLVLFRVFGHGSAFSVMASPATMKRTWWALTARC